MISGVHHGLAIIIKVLPLPPLGITLVLVICFNLVACLWGIFLCRFERDPACIRRVMALVLFAAVVTQVLFATCGFIHPWVAKLSVFIDVWGGLDAILRYPARHELESFFSAKQFSLQATKVVAYVGGFRHMREHTAKFAAGLLFNHWGLSFLYLAALAVGCPCAEDEERDVDLALRAWRVVAYPKHRSECYISCQRWWHRRLLNIIENPAGPFPQCLKCLIWPCRYAQSFRRI